MNVTGRDSLTVRTYERGVESETPACGTGIVAAAVVAARRGLVTPPVKVRAASGDVLRVDFVPAETGAKDVFLSGPALYVFRGNLSREAED
jgi:diaminopimelate epimerase